MPRAYDRADALIADPDVDAVYIATPPSTHCELALAVAARGQALPRREADGDEPRRVRAHERGVRDGRRAVVRRLLPPRAAAIPEGARRDRRGAHRPHLGGARERLRAAGHRTTRRRAGDSTRPSPAAGSSSTSRRTASTCSTSCSDRSRTCRGFADQHRAAPTPSRTSPPRRSGSRTAAARHGRLELQRRSVGRHDRPDRVDGGDRDAGLHRRRCHRDATGRAEEVIPVRNPPHVHQPLIQTIVDELRGTRPVRVDRRKRRAGDVGDGPVPGGVLREETDRPVGYVASGLRPRVTTSPRRHPGPRIRHARHRRYRSAPAVRPAVFTAPTSYTADRRQRRARPGLRDRHAQACRLHARRSARCACSRCWCPRRRASSCPSTSASTRQPCTRWPSAMCLLQHHVIERRRRSARTARSSPVVTASSVAQYVSASPSLTRDGGEPPGRCRVPSTPTPSPSARDRS